MKSYNWNYSNNCYNIRLHHLYRYNTNNNSKKLKNRNNSIIRVFKNMLS